MEQINRRETRIAVSTLLNRLEALQFAYALSLGKVMEGRSWDEEAAKRAQFALEATQARKDVEALLDDLEEER